MRGLLILLSRYGATLLFIVLEILCFYLIVNYNQSQSDIFFNSVNIFSGKLEKEANKWEDFLNLDILNDSLIQENARLKKLAVNLSFPRGITPADVALGDASLDYDVIPAKIVNQTIHLRNNFLTLNRGRNHGITPGMGVIDKEGLVGIVDRAGKKYARVMSVLHSNCRISAAIKHKNYFGVLSWKFISPQLLAMDDLPKYANITVGDTVITSGFSTMFPPGITIGNIESFEVIPGSSFYKITVRTNNDFASLNHVYVINKLDKEEQKRIEQL